MTDAYTINEKAAHNVLREMAQRLWDVHGIRIDNVSFSWRDQSSITGFNFVVDEVNVHTFTKESRSED